MNQLFVSYSRVDTEPLQELAALLGYVFPDIWFDTGRLKGGDDWWDEIVQQIQCCDHFLYLLSRESVESSFCQEELQIAQRCEKHIIPIRVRDRATPPESLAHVQYIDWYGDTKLNGLAQIFAAIFETASSPADEVLAHDLRVLRDLWQYLDKSKHHGFLRFPRKRQVNQKDSFYYLERYTLKRQHDEYALIDDELEARFCLLDQALIEFCTRFTEYADEPSDADEYIYLTYDHPCAAQQEADLSALWEETRYQRKRIYRLILRKYPRFFDEK